jgi:hypothetical protein
VQPSNGENQTQVAALEKSRTWPELYRDSERVKETMHDFEATKEGLKQLYEHGGEAIKLN